MGGSVQSCPIVENHEDQENRHGDFTSFCTLAGGQFFFARREDWERKLDDEDICQPLLRVNNGYTLYLNNAKATVVKMSVNELRQICRAYEVEILDQIPSKVALEEDEYWAFHIIGFEPVKVKPATNFTDTESDRTGPQSVDGQAFGWLKSLWRGKSNSINSVERHDSDCLGSAGFPTTNDEDGDEEDHPESTLRQEYTTSSSAEWRLRDQDTPRFTQPLSSSSFEEIQSRVESTPCHVVKSPDVLASPIPAPVIITRADKAPTWTKRLDELGEDVESGTSSSCSDDDELLTRSLQRCTSKRTRQHISNVPSAWANFELGLSSPEKPKQTPSKVGRRTPITRAQAKVAMKTSPKQASKRMKKAPPSRNKSPMKSSQRQRRRVSSDEDD